MYILYKPTGKIKINTRILAIKKPLREIKHKDDNSVTNIWNNGFIETQAMYLTYNPNFEY